MSTLTIGHSPDADDAFMFFALAKERITIGDYTIGHIMEDIETLNRRALGAELDVTAISAAVYPDVARDYRIMSCGSSVGRNYGPLVLSKRKGALKDFAGASIAIPGFHTTAYMLLQLYMDAGFDPVNVEFDHIMDAIRADEVDAGVIIHEGQITWEKSGLHKILDLGEAWMADTSLPIPLGLDVINRALGDEKMFMIARALKDSIVHAREHENEAIDYAMQFGRGIDRDTCRDFVRMYVNDDTVDMGEEGRKSLQTLYERAHARGIITELPPLDIIAV